MRVLTATATTTTATRRRRRHHHLLSRSRRIHSHLTIRSKETKRLEGTSVAHGFASIPLLSQAGRRVAEAVPGNLQARALVFGSVEWLLLVDQQIGTQASYPRSIGLDAASEL